MFNQLRRCNLLRALKIIWRQWIVSSALNTSNAYTLESITPIEDELLRFT